MLETIKMIQVGITECASHSDASKLLNSKNADGGRSTTIIPTNIFV